MSHVAKIIELVGSSPTSWQDATEVALREASQTLHGIRGIDVTHFTAEVQDNGITMWRVTVKIAFGIERH
jgi:flavin-binding protein dodecin